MKPMKTMPLFCVVGLVTVIVTSSAQESQAHLSEVPGAQMRGADASLIVVRAEVPLYPALAVAARLSGVVHVRISIKDGSVRSVDATSTAPPILVSAAKDNVGTWRFAPDVSSTVEVTYIYELAKEESVVRENPRITMDLPSLVRITAKPVKAVPLHGN